MGPIQSLSTIAANLRLKKMCNMQHCCSGHHANANPFNPVVGHFKSPSGVLNNVLCESQLASEHMPSQAARNAHAKIEWTKVDAAHIMDMGSEREAATTSHFDLGRRTVRRNVPPHVWHMAAEERNRPR
mmetsp:Transcript_2104/g.3309  ORF Transcript_2104/g.3309 Transcript_2104/m.3309 type:complete len:129 (+) Transcript_2104:430-816(+)